MQALAKGDRSELAVEMLTEIGVTEIVPVAGVPLDRPLVGRRGASGRGQVAGDGPRGGQAVPRLRIPAVAAPIEHGRLLARRIAAADWRWSCTRRLESRCGR